MIKLTKNDTYALIDTEGAQLIALYKGGSNLLWGRDPAVWAQSAPLLFPICGRLRENTYYHNGQAYSMQPHGFAKQSLFAVKEQSEQSVTLSIVDNEQTHKHYPFSFEFSVTYTLSENELNIEFTITNHSNEPMPFSLGGHWGFALEESIDGYSLQFDAPVTLEREILDGAFISGQTAPLATKGNTLPLSYHICDNDTWVIRNAPHACTLMLGEKKVVRLEYPDSPHLLIWTKPDARFVCLEPWNGMPDGKESTELKVKDSICLANPASKTSFAHKILF